MKLFLSVPLLPRLRADTYRRKKILLAERPSWYPGYPTAVAAMPQEDPPAPPAPVKTAVNGKVKEAYKRQISQAIPHNERDNGQLSRPKAAQASSRSTQRGTQEAAWEGTKAGT